MTPDGLSVIFGAVCYGLAGYITIQRMRIYASELEQVLDSVCEARLTSFCCRSRSAEACAAGLSVPTSACGRACVAWLLAVLIRCANAAQFVMWQLLP